VIPVPNTWWGAAGLGQASPKGVASAITTSGIGLPSEISRRAAAGCALRGQQIGVEGKPDLASPRVPTDAFAMLVLASGTMIVTGEFDPDTTWAMLGRARPRAWSLTGAQGGTEIV